MRYYGFKIIRSPHQNTLIYYFRRWVGFDESVESIKAWLRDIEHQLPQDIVLHETLEEKQNQLQIYRNLLYDTISHQQDIVDLRDKVDSLPESNTKIDQQLSTITEQHSKVMKRAQQFVERYEMIVSDHQQFNKAISDTTDWVGELQSNVNLWADTDVERITLCSNLERLKVRFWRFENISGYIAFYS